MSIRPEMTAQQAEALAAFLVSLRPGQRSWTKTACVDALAAAAARHTKDTELLTRAALRVAITPSIRTPEVIAMEGSHWDGVSDLKDIHEPLRATRCADCHGLHMVGAPCDPQPTRAEARTQRIDELRRQVADADRSKIARRDVAADSEETSDA